MSLADVSGPGPGVVGKAEAGRCGDELEVRIPLTAFCARSTCSAGRRSRSATLQLVAPRDEVVLAAGLAWERGT